MIKELARILLVDASQNDNTHGARRWIEIPAEIMRRDDDLYKWGMNIEQNFPAVKPYCGSCIFFHIWRKPGSGTEGCTAMAEEDLLALMSWADPAQHPLVVQLPTEIYEKVRKEWDLP
jgi:D-alanyl-D-alanine dipeptidase